MNELARHIQKLLLESDFAIIPGFGGFMAHYTPAIRDSKNNLFIPPSRTIGFNDQLVLNDGLLLQSYMSVHNMGIDEAKLLITEAIDNLRDKLEENGSVELKGIGILHCDANNKYSFKAKDNSIDCPLLYGLKSFEMLEIKQIQKDQITKELFGDSKNIEQGTSTETSKAQSYNLMGAVAVSILAIASFFFFSIPVENTEIVNANYAKILPTELLSKTSQFNITTSPIGTPVEERKEITTSNKTEDITYTRISPSSQEKLYQEPIAEIKTEIKTNNTISVTAENKPFHIIVASAIKTQHANDLVNTLHEEGYAHAQVLNKDGRTRVSADCFSNKEEAYQALQKLSKKTAYQNAWIFKAN